MASQNLTTDPSIPPEYLSQAVEFRKKLQSLADSGYKLEVSNKLVVMNDELSQGTRLTTKNNACYAETKLSLNDFYQSQATVIRSEKGAKAAESFLKENLYEISPDSLAECAFIKVRGGADQVLVSGKSPLDRLLREFGTQLVAKSNNSATLSIPSLGMDVKQGADGIAVVSVYDYMNPNSPLVLRMPISVGNLRADLELLNTVYKKELAARKPLVEEQIKKYTASSKAAEVSPALLGAPLSDQERRDLGVLLSQYSIKVSVLPSGLPIDQADTYKFEIRGRVEKNSLPQVNLGNSLAKDSKQGIGLQGIIREITLTRELPREVQKPKRTSPGEADRDPLAAMGIRQAGTGPDGRTLFSREKTRTDGSRYEEISIPVSLPLSRTPQETVPFTIRTQTGTRLSFVNLISHQTAQQVADVGNVRFVTTWDPSLIPPSWRSRMGEISAGVTGSERYFGHLSSPGSQAVVLAPSNYQNAHFESSTPNAIFFYGKLLEENVNQKGIAYHETGHRVDRNFQLSSGEFQEAHKRLLVKHNIKSDTDFFSQLDEKNFLNKLRPANEPIYFGGHSRDNSAECWTSLMHSLKHARWEEAIATYSSDFRGDYTSLLIAAGNVLEAKSREKKVPENVVKTFGANLNRAIAFLNTLPK